MGRLTKRTMDARFWMLDPFIVQLGLDRKTHAVKSECPSMELRLITLTFCL
jgi:hypothetical protein